MEIALNDHERVKLLNTDAVYGIMQRILLRENTIDQNRGRPALEHTGR